MFSLRFYNTRGTVKRKRKIATTKIAKVNVSKLIEASIFTEIKMFTANCQRIYGIGFSLHFISTSMIHSVQYTWYKLQALNQKQRSSDNVNNKKNLYKIHCDTGRHLDFVSFGFEQTETINSTKQNVFVAKMCQTKRKWNRMQEITFQRGYIESVTNLIVIGFLSPFLSEQVSEIRQR